MQMGTPATALWIEYSAPYRTMADSDKSVSNSFNNMDVIAAMVRESPKRLFMAVPSG